MTPQDLKTGMLIEFRSGIIGIVVDDKIYDSQWDCITVLQRIMESFENINTDIFDLVAVYSKGTCVNKMSGLFSTDSRKLLWKRKLESQERMEAIEKQMRELADELESIRNGEE